MMMNDYSDVTNCFDSLTLAFAFGKELRSNPALPAPGHRRIPQRGRNPLADPLGPTGGSPKGGETP